MSINTHETIIDLKDINFFYNYKKINQAQALKDINLKINRGDYLVFFGPSGCGKTTLTYLIGGIETEKSGSGEIFVNNTDIRKLSNDELASFRQKDIGIIFQQFNLIPSLNVLDNVALPMTFMGVDKKTRKEEAHKILVRLNIDQYAHRFPQELSGGQQQRVGIARALANNPPIILADEPLGSLDSENSEHVLDFLKELNEKDGRTIIMVTHQAWSVRDANKIVYLKDGAIVKVGESLESVLVEEKPLSPRLFKELYQDLSQDELRVKILASLLLRGFSEEEIKRFEFFLGERLSDKIDSETFITFLDKPFHDEGVGLWRQRALKIAGITEDLITHKKEISDIYRELEKNKESSLYVEVENLSTWVLKEYTGRLLDIQKSRLHEEISKYLRKATTLEQFQIALSLARSKNGVGFSVRATQHISDRLEAALLLGDTKKVIEATPLLSKNKQHQDEPVTLASLLTDMQPASPSDIRETPPRATAKNEGESTSEPQKMLPQPDNQNPLE
jgi:putative ABC transport system ATP-binding protein